MQTCSENFTTRCGRLDTIIKRRSFLKRSWQGVSAALVGSAFSDFGAPARADSLPFHLHPHYRAETPLDAVLAKTKAGLDEFPSEKEHDRIA